MAEELEFVVEIGVAGLFSDFVFELMNRTGRVDGIDTAAVGANEVVTVNAGKEKSEVCGAFVETETTDHTFFAKTLQEAEDRGLVALF